MKITMYIINILITIETYLKYDIIATYATNVYYQYLPSD